MKQIQLTKDMLVSVDDIDFEWLNQYKWYYSKAGNNGYACSKMGGMRKGNYGEKIFHMHRVIMDAPQGTFVDHIDGNGLNNQKSNLRLVTHAENLRNRSGQLASRTLYKIIRIWRIEITFRFYLK